MVSLFSLSNPGVFSESSGTIYLSEPLPVPEGLMVILVTDILAVVLMFLEM